jgi:hypothetical protein
MEQERLSDVEDQTFLEWLEAERPDAGGKLASRPLAAAVKFPTPTRAGLVRESSSFRI